MADQRNSEERLPTNDTVGDGGAEDRRPTGMVVREAERRDAARRRGDPDPEVQNVSGSGTVSERIERESVTGSHGHGGEIDLEVRRLEEESTQ